MFDKTYELPLSRHYVRHWGVTEAIRELFQNALDSDSPFEYELGEDFLVLRSRFSRLEPKTLLLGTTSKADAPDKIGSFGEGYKIALLVLEREGRKVSVMNNDLLWEPEFRHSKHFEEEILCVRERRLPENRGKGLAFLVAGLSREDLEAVVAMNMHMWPSVGRVVETSKGRILLEHPGKLFVNGLFVCETQLKYGYDMKPEFLKLERDRQTVSTFDLQFLAKDMWFETGQHEKIAELIADKAPDMHYANYGTPEVVREACYRLFQERHPGAVVASSQKELEQLVAQGLERVVVVNETFRDCVVTSNSYMSREAVFVRSPKQVMEDWFRENRKHMRREGIVAFKELLAQAGGWKLK